MILDKYVVKNGKRKKKWKLNFGSIYWMYNSKGEIQNDYKILNENTDLDEFGIYLSKEQILIPIKFFDK